MNHPEEVKALMLGESQKADLVTESSIQGAKAMKSSEILRKALQRMDGGNKWTQRGWFWELEPGQANIVPVGERKCCSVGALMEQVNRAFESRAYRFLVAATGQHPTGWNDTAINFSVIQQGFEKAIALAEAEGD